jgi:hypothetical protein
MIRVPEPVTESAREPQGSKPGNGLMMKSESEDKMKEQNQKEIKRQMFSTLREAESIKRKGDTMNTNKWQADEYSAGGALAIKTPYSQTALVKGYVYKCRGADMVIFKRDHEKVKEGKFVHVMALDPRTGWTGEVGSNELTPVTTDKISPFFGPEGQAQS